MSAKYFDIIESYLTGQMDPDQKEQFLKSLKQDAALREEFSLQKAEHEAMELLVSRQLKSEMNSWKESPPPSPFGFESEEKVFKVAATKQIYLRWLIAAAILALVIVPFYIMMRSDSIDLDSNNSAQVEPDPTENNIPEKDSGQNEEKQQQPLASEEEKISPEEETESGSAELLAFAGIANDFYESPDQLQMRSGSSDQNSMSSYDKALDAFTEKKYAQALKDLGPSGGNEQSNEIFLRGNILFQMKNYSGAARQFEKLSRDEMLPLYEDARWYLLLSYAAGLPGTKSKYESLSKELLEEGGFYEEKVRELMSKIKL